MARAPEIIIKLDAPVAKALKESLLVLNSIDKKIPSSELMEKLYSLEKEYVDFMPDISDKLYAIFDLLPKKQAADINH